MKINDVVMVKQDVEVSPLNIVKKATIAKVLDFTVPNYVLIKYSNDNNYDCVWIDKKYLTVIKTDIE